ncbi:hypothetical protein XELAEV_18002018mg, partial [Xenopus laevis]
MPMSLVRVLIAAQYEKRYIVPKFGSRLVFFRRYIDDMIMIWRGNETDFVEMVEELNNVDSPVKFTYSINPFKINFLDVEIMINGSKLDYTLYRKPTDNNVLLDYSSCHPSPMKRSLPISQFCRVLRNNSDPSASMQQISDMWTRFKERGYPDRLLSQSLEIAKKCCSESTTPDRGQAGVVFSTKFNACTKNLGKLVRKQWNI